MDHIKVIDKLGRLVIPFEIRDKLNIKAGDSLKIIVKDNSINLELTPLKNCSTCKYNKNEECILFRGDSSTNKFACTKWTERKKE